MAAECYEVMARESNVFFKNFPSQDGFALQNWGLFLEQARATLAHMLTLPIDEGQKTLIHEALVLDGSLQRHRESNTEALFS